MKKIVVALMSLFLILPSFITSSEVVSAQESTEESVEFSNAEKQQIKDDIEFYFTEAGYINDNGEYIITDIDALDQKFSAQGIELEVLPEFRTQMVSTSSIPQYGVCVVANALPFPFTGTAYELGVALASDDNFMNALTQGSVDLATELFMDYATTMLPANLLSELTNFSIVTNLAVALVSCGL